MPINIYRSPPEGSIEKVAWLCDGSWNLPEQAYELMAWLNSATANLKPGNLIADIGFRARPDASGGGSAFSPKELARMSELDMSLWLSEYPAETAAA
jgi:hypothetical protein